MSSNPRQVGIPIPTRGTHRLGDPEESVAPPVKSFEELYFSSKPGTPSPSGGSSAPRSSSKPKAGNVQQQVGFAPSQVGFSPGQGAGSAGKSAGGGGQHQQRPPKAPTAASSGPAASSSSQDKGGRRGSTDRPQKKAGKDAEGGGGKKNNNQNKNAGGAASTSSHAGDPKRRLTKKERKAIEKEREDAAAEGREPADVATVLARFAAAAKPPKHRRDSESEGAKKGKKGKSSGDGGAGGGGGMGGGGGVGGGIGGGDGDNGGSPRRCESDHLQQHGDGSRCASCGGGPRAMTDAEREQERRSYAAMSKRVDLFSHLPQDVPPITSGSVRSKVTRAPKIQRGAAPPPSTALHGSVLRVALKIAHREIDGPNARCIAMLHAIRDFVQDYTTPENKTLQRDISTALTPQIGFLVEARPLCTSMATAIKHLKRFITSLDQDLVESEAKDLIVDTIDKFIDDRIVSSMESLANNHAVEKVSDGDVLLTFGNDRGIEMVFRAARERGTDFRVVVVDSRLGLDGQTMVRDLDSIGIDCTYLHFNGLAGIMPEVTKVFLGCDTCLSNGSVKAPSGTALVAMMAHDHGVPVLVCCETYRFSDKTLFDSITNNELASPDAIATAPHCPADKQLLADWRSMPNIKLLNLVYDITPIQFVTVVVTEHGLLPPTSIPVILREYGADAKI